MQHPFDLLPLGNGANLMFTPCPGTQTANLPDSLQQLAAAGACAVLTLMPSEEMQRNAVLDLPEICAQLQLQWFHLPIEDDHAPERAFADAWQLAKGEIHGLLDSGKTIAIHCKGGTGRTGMVAAKILLERGLGLDDVITQVRAVRPKALRIALQLDYITQIANEDAANKR